MSGQCELIHIARLTVEGQREAHGVISVALHCIEINILRTPAIRTSSVLHRKTFIEQEHAFIFYYIDLMINYLV